MSPSSSTSTSSNGGAYREPSDLLKRLFLPPETPSLTLSSDQQWLLHAGEPPLPSIEVLAKPEEKLAGIRFDPILLAPARLDFAYDLKAQNVQTTAASMQDIPLPENSEGIRYIRFNPNPPTSYCRQQFVFASKVKNENKFQIYLCHLDNTTEQWETKHLEGLDSYRLNFCYGCAYQFTSDGKYLLCKVVPEKNNYHPSEPPKEPVSVGPSVQAVQPGARKAPGRTYQDLLKNKFDEEKFRYYLTTELLQVDVTSTSSSSSSSSIKVVPQSKGGKLFSKISSSPNGRYLLVETMTQLSYAVPLRRFGRDIQIWDMTSNGNDDNNNNNNNNNVIPVASIPVDDEIPLSYDACSRHPRSFCFHPCKDASIIFAHAQDGGDPENEPSPEGERDAIFMQDIIADNNNNNNDDGDGDGTPSLSEPPTKVCGLEWRYDDIDFTESGMAIVDEYRWKDRMERKWRLDDTSDENNKKVLVWERSWEDRYTSPGSPVYRRAPNGYYVIKESAPGQIFLKGAGASPLGDRPFLDQMNLVTLKKERLWRCKAPTGGELTDASQEVANVLPTTDDRQDVYESLIMLMDDNDTIMISRESKTTPRNYYVTKLSDLVSAQVQITHFPHPQPDLLGVQKELVQYERKDGVKLTANLYTPANYDGKTPRPTLFWAYPREFKNAKAAGQVKGSKHKFVSASWASPVHWAAKGWVIMDDFSLPIVGEGDAQPNDTFIEQIVDGATAAVDYVADQRGFCDRTKCAVGGHSYGSFMTAHLLSHTSLFAAGIGRSGAFNRTLTPMSFQAEDRSIWEAPDTYITMSPLMHVKKYSEQERVGKLLLIHGQNDENSGTHPMQSERYFAALKAFGIESRLCMLPHERHSYLARESILHMAWEQEEWLKSLEEEKEK